MKALLCIIPLLLCSCVKDEPLVLENQPPVQATSGKVYVTCEGNFGSSNGAVTLYDPASGGITEDHFKSVNGKGAGDVVQSISKINGELYVVVNNSGKIVVCDLNLKAKREIGGLRSPRYIHAVSNSKAYITDLYANVITVLDLSSGSVKSKIPCSGWTEQIVTVYNKAFVTNIGRAYAYVINTVTDHLEDSIFVGSGAAGIVCDKLDRVWILSPGDATKKEVGRLTRMAATGGSAETIATFASGDYPSYLCINPGKDTLYFSNNGIYRMRIDEAVPSAPFIAAEKRNVYGMAVSPGSELYFSDAIDYNQRSNVYVYDAAGNSKRTFKASINANGFYFE